MATLETRDCVFCERTGKIFDKDCDCDHCVKYREELRRTAKPTKIHHSRKGCYCPRCEKRRVYGRQYEKQRLEGHSLSTCKCSLCDRRRKTQDNRYERRKMLQRNLRNSFKKQVLGLLGGKCANCGFIPEDVCQIDFHERNGRIAKKIGKNEVWSNPSKLRGLAYGRALILKNIDEIVPLCRNCHVRLTCLACRCDIVKKIEYWRRPIVVSK